MAWLVLTVFMEKVNADCRAGRFIRVCSLAPSYSPAPAPVPLIKEVDGAIKLPLLPPAAAGVAAAAIVVGPAGRPVGRRGDGDREPMRR